MKQGPCPVPVPDLEARLPRVPPGAATAAASLTHIHRSNAPNPKPQPSEAVAMTSPVVMAMGGSESLAPEEKGSVRMSFVMPS